MESLNECIKLVVLFFATLFFLTGLGLNLIQIERSDISKLRYCPHCSEELLP